MQSLRLGRLASSMLRAGMVVVGAGLAVAVPRAAEAQVEWKSGTGVAPKRESRANFATLVSQLKARPDHRRVVAHFEKAPTTAQREAMREAGLTLLDYVGSGAFFASLSERADARAVANLPLLITLEPVQNTWKLHRDYASGIVRSWFVVRGLGDFEIAKSGAATRQQLTERGLDPVVAAGIALHSDADMGAVQALVMQLGGRVVHQYETMKGMDIELPLSAMDQLVAADAVRWVEPPLPPFAACNDSNRALTGVNTVNEAPYGLDGTGVDVLVYDAGTVGAHVGLAGRLLIGDSSGVSGHATHVAGTIGGTGAGQTGNPNRGMATGIRQFISYGVEGFTAGYFRHIVGDTEQDYLAAIAQGADLANNSVGSNTAPNGWDCSWHGDYGLFNEMLDTLIRGERDGQGGVPFRTIWAAGNERGAGRCNEEPNGGAMGFYSIAPPQAGKNQVCVGAVNSNDDSVASFSSWGPTDDGRLKPDFVAPGCQSNGDQGVTSCSGTNSYASLCGTSMASPTAAGIAAMFLQDWRQINSDEPDPLNSTIKAIFAHTAVDIDDVGPDYRSGYGSIRAPRIIDQLRSGNYLQGSVGQSENYSFVVVVSPTDTEFKVTLAYDDYRGTANVNPNLTNDLDIVVLDPQGNRHYPWTLNPLNPDAPAVKTEENHRDNIEQVHVANPIPGGWIVQIRGTDVPMGPQAFSVAASPLLVNCSDAGIASLDRGLYNCSATSAGLRVVDCGLNTSDEVIDTVSVVVSSTSDPSGEVIVLTESSAESATFIGSVALSTNGTAGSVRISGNDTLSLTYVDLDNGAGGSNISVVSNAFVDCTPPVISGVTVDNVQPRSGVVTFNSNEQAIGTVQFGTSCETTPNVAEFDTFDVAHSLTLSGLVNNTNYYFTVTATDRAGNTATYDNNGACYSFGTLDAPDSFTEIFQSADNDMEGTRISFVPNGSVDFYQPCTEKTSTYGTDPAGGTRLTLANNAFAQVNLLDGQSVSYFGTQYSTLFVSSNGLVSFNVGTIVSNESLDAHFQSPPKISLLFDDLNPNAGGQVSWRQLSDRVAITWHNVPEINTTNNNSFQLEMFFNGTIALTWLNIDATDGLAGLSRGTGNNPDYTEADLSNLQGGCFPMPPMAINGNTSCFQGTTANISLIASDDGRPDGTLNFVISSLPEHGRLVDPNGGLIRKVPYTLANGGRIVQYRPLGLFTGNDSFEFHANDSGEAPDGGDSNTAVVAVLVRSNDNTPVAQFLVNDTNPNWANAGGPSGWGFGIPTGGGSHDRDPTSGFTGQRVLGFNLSGDYANGLFPPVYTTSTAMDLTGYAGATLEFRRWLGIDASTFDRASIQISTNGTTWDNVWLHDGPAISESSWSLQSYDISSFADGRSSVQIRFGMGTTNGTVSYPGWNLDDIRVIARVDVPQCDCDWNAIGGINSQDFFDFLSDFFSANADYNNSGETNSQDFFDFLACFFQGC